MTARSLFSFFHHPHFLPEHLRAFAFMAIFHRAAEASILVTLPVFLFRISENVPLLHLIPTDPFARGIIAVCLYLLLPRLLYLPLLPFFTRALRTIGLVPALILGLVFSALSLGGLVFLGQAPWLFWLLPFTRTLWLFFYWMSYHLYLASEAKLSQVGQQLGSLEFLAKLTATLAPLLGVFITVMLDFQASFGIAIMFLILSGIFALRLPSRRTDQTWQWSTFLEAWNKPEQRLSLIAIGGFLWEALGLAVFWPLFLVLNFQNLQSAGYLLSGAAFLSLLFTYLSGWVFDHRHKPTNFARALGGVLASLWLPRMFLSHTPWALVITDSADHIVGGMYSTVFFSSLIWKARSSALVSFYGNFEIAISIAFILGLTAVMVMALTSWSWTALFLSFLFGGLLSLTFRFTKRE